jgi:hypothetical protein
MKPINEMNLSQLADQIEGKLEVPIGYHLLQFDIADRLRELHELTRWIPIAERLPTFEDADEEGYVFIRERENESPHRTYHTVGRYDSLKVPDYFYTVTHWRRIDKPEATP